jgi:hypothetical protein
VKRRAEEAASLAAYFAVPAFFAADGVSHRNWLLLTLAVILAALVAVVASFAWRCSRADPRGSQARALKRAMSRVGDGSFWLDREGHRVLRVNHEAHLFWELTVWDEDDAREVVADRGGVLAWTSYRFPPVLGGVVRITEGIRVEVDEDGESADTTVRPSRLLQLRLHARRARAMFLSSQMLPDAAELRELTLSVEAAEFLSPASAS